MCAGEGGGRGVECLSKLSFSLIWGSRSGGGGGGVPMSHVDSKKWSPVAMKNPMSLVSLTFYLGKHRRMSNYGVISRPIFFYSSKQLFQTLLHAEGIRVFSRRGSNFKHFFCLGLHCENRKLMIIYSFFFFFRHVHTFRTLHFHNFMGDLC